MLKLFMSQKELAENFPGLKDTDMSIGGDTIPLPRDWWGGMKGRHHTEETKLVMRNKKLGRLHSLETKKKMSESHQGQVPWNFGKKSVFTAEAIQKMSEAKKGEKNPMYNKKHTEETKQIIIDKMNTEETKRKMRYGHARKLGWLI